MTYFYAAVFSKDEENGIFHISFPDLPGCETKSRSLENAMKTARENMAATLLEMEEKGMPVPAATEEADLRRYYRDQTVCTFRVDMRSYREYRAYQRQHAARQSAAWAGEKKHRRLGFFARVFGGSK